MKNKIMYLGLTMMLIACGSSKQNEHIYWVNSSKTDCVGVGKMTCLQIQKTDTLDMNGDWKLFYSHIEGFDYEPGYLYKLKVKEAPIENPPADASSVKYTLVEELEKNVDTRFVIHDIWILKSVNGIEIDRNNINIIPQIELNVTTMKIMGSNGCNRISGGINKLSDTELEFSPLAETRKMCPNMEISNQFSKALFNTKFYKKENATLIFLDKDMKELMSLKKVD